MGNRLVVLKSAISVPFELPHISKTRSNAYGPFRMHILRSVVGLRTFPSAAHQSQVLGHTLFSVVPHASWRKMLQVALVLIDMENALCLLQVSNPIYLPSVRF